MYNLTVQQKNNNMYTDLELLWKPKLPPIMMQIAVLKGGKCIVQHSLENLQDWSYSEVSLRI